MVVLASRADGGYGRRHGLLLEITECPVVALCWTGEGATHPCRRIVETQPADPPTFQVPEPWTGHLDRAPLLFVASRRSAATGCTRLSRGCETTGSRTSRTGSATGRTRSGTASTTRWHSRRRMEGRTRLMGPLLGGNTLDGPDAAATPAGAG